MSEKSKKQKVSIVEKMGLFMVCAGNIPLMGLLSGFFMIYYTNVVGTGSTGDPVFNIQGGGWNQRPDYGIFSGQISGNKNGKISPYDYSGNNHLCYKLYFTVVWRSLDSGRKICDCVCDVSAAGLDV